VGTAALGWSYETGDPGFGVVGSPIIEKHDYTAEQIFWATASCYVPIAIWISAITGIFVRTLSSTIQICRIFTGAINIREVSERLELAISHNQRPRIDTGLRPTPRSVRFQRSKMRPSPWQPFTRLASGDISADPFVDFSVEWSVTPQGDGRVLGNWWATLLGTRPPNHGSAAAPYCYLHFSKLR
jgi:hypothetical protein